MNILNYVNLIRSQLGESILDKIEDEKEIEKYLGVLGKEKYLREKYIECEGFREIHPVFFLGKEKGLLINRAVHRYTIIECEVYMVLVGEKYEIKMATGRDCKKRVADEGEIERYNEFKNKNEKLIRKAYRYPVGSEIEVLGERYRYLGIYDHFRLIKKIVLEKKESREVMYYNAEDIF